MLPDMSGLFNLIKWILIICVPLGLWKIIDIIIWIVNHVGVVIL